MAALHTEQLQYLAGLLGHRVQSTKLVVCLGVFPANCLPSLTTPQTSSADVYFIVNSDPHNKPGKHWLAFYFDRSKSTLEYFDSYGLPLKFYRDVYNALVGRMLRVVAVNDVGFLQDLQSVACGYYCIMYLHWRIRFNSSARAITKLSKLANHASERDASVVSQMHKLMHKLQCSVLPCTFTYQTQSACPYSELKKRK